MHNNLRKLRLGIKHESHKGLIDAMHAANLKALPAEQRQNVLRSLLELKRQEKLYDFGPVQTAALAKLIELAQSAKTIDDLVTINRLTCTLGINKH